MTVIVEDGSGIQLANSPVSVEDADAFFAAQGNFDWDASEDKDAALIRGTQYVAQRYGARWKGKRTHGREQGIDWPRTGVTDAEGNDIADDEMPIEYKHAVYLTSLQASLGNLDVTTDQPVFITSEAIGTIRLTYEKSQSWNGAAVAFPDCLDDILYPLTSTSSRSTARFFERT